MTDIIVCANNIDEIGGAQRVVHSLAAGLSDRGYHVSAVGMTPYRPRHEFIGEYPCHVLMSHEWPAKSSQTRKARADLRGEAVSGLARMLVDGTGGVVVTAQVWSMEILTDAWTVVPEDVRECWRVIGQYHGAFAAAAGGRDLERIKRVYPQVAAFTALTSEDAAAFTRVGLNNVRVMPNAWELGSSNSQDRMTSKSGGVVTYLGRISHEKGVDLLVDAWSLISMEAPGWRLQIVGDGPSAGEVRRRADELAGADRIEWIPTTSEPEAVLRASDLVVLPSRTEGLPLVVGEAQACGVPVIASDCSSGVRQLIGDWGMLVPREDSRALARALRAAIADASWRLSAGQRARESMQEYRSDLILDRWEKLIARVLS